jgi:hypothetical protein
MLISLSQEPTVYPEEPAPPYEPRTQANPVALEATQIQLTSIRERNSEGTHPQLTPPTPAVFIDTLPRLTHLIPDDESIPDEPLPSYADVDKDFYTPEDGASATCVFINVLLIYLSTGGPLLPLLFIYCCFGSQPRSQLVGLTACGVSTFFIGVYLLLMISISPYEYYGPLVYTTCTVTVILGSASTLWLTYVYKTKYSKNTSQMLEIELSQVQ